MSDHTPRWCLLLALALLVGGFVGGGAPTASGHPAGGGTPSPLSGTPTGWTTYHGGENRTGYSAQPGPSLTSAAWFRCVSPYQIRSGPVVDGDRLFVGDAFGFVYALNLSANGTPDWNRSVGSLPLQLDADHGTLLVGTVGGQLWALDETNGLARWTKDLNASVVQGVAVVGPDAVVATSDGLLHALDVATGATVWTVSTGTPAGAPSVEAGRIYLATAAGTVEAWSSAGAPLWSSQLPGTFATAPAVSGLDLVVASLRGDVDDLWDTNGTLHWRWNASLLGGPDPVRATPAIAPGRVFATFDSATVRAFDRSTGALLWTVGGAYSGYPNTAAVAATPSGVYSLVNGYDLLQELDPTNGSTVSYADLASFAFDSPAVVDGSLFLGEETGCVGAFGSQGAFARWPVSGTVVNATDGTPVADAYVSVNGEGTATDPNGQFVLSLTNGTYELNTFRPGYAITNTTVVVAGPTSGVVIRLPALRLFPVVGVLRDQDSAQGLSGAQLTLLGPNEFSRSTTTGPGGAFRLLAPNGTSSVSAVGSPGHAPVALEVVVAGAPLSDVILLAPPIAVPPGASAPAWVYLALPAAALLCAAWYAGTREMARRRVGRGLPPAVLSRFSFYVISRVLLLFAQVTFLLGVLYVVTNILPYALTGRALCSTQATGCAGCGLDQLLCSAPLVVHGFGQEVVNLFTGQWGTETIRKLTEPTTTFLAWWLPNSLQLGLVAFGAAVAIAYPVALVAGWRQGGVFDPVARAASLLGLLTPSFLLVILAVGVVVPSWVHQYGELPYGLLPGTPWFLAHGGQPGWVGDGPRTYPTGFSLVDGALHQDWAFEQIVLLKTLWQASVIALVYVAVFLRHSWSVVATASREPFVTNARSRSVPERTLLWRYTGRRVLPFFVLTIALTFPAFIVTQALVESLFFDPGVGYLFLSDLTGIAGAPGLVQVGGVLLSAIFLLIVLSLAVNLVADVLARSLDPRLREGGR